MKWNWEQNACIYTNWFVDYISIGVCFIFNNSFCFDLKMLSGFYILTNKGENQQKKSTQKEWFFLCFFFWRRRRNCVLYFARGAIRLMKFRWLSCRATISMSFTQIHAHILWKVVSSYGFGMNIWSQITHEKAGEINKFAFDASVCIYQYILKISIRLHIGHAMAIRSYWYLYSDSTLHTFLLECGCFGFSPLKIKNKYVYDAYIIFGVRYNTHHIFRQQKAFCEGEYSVADTLSHTLSLCPFSFTFNWHSALDYCYSCRVYDVSHTHSRWTKDENTVCIIDCQASYPILNAIRM